jgi:hypothetical protein
MANSLSSRRVMALPSSIGRYDIVTLLSEGGMARVYVALQRGAFAEKLVVLKQLRPEFSADSEFLAMFMDEARITMQLNHPNVVHTYEVVAEEPDFHITMEFLEGQSLSQLLRRVGRAAFPVNLHIWMLSQVLAGLHYAHELRDLDGTPLGVVHRDVSPSNVLVTSTGEVKVLDFGIAKAAGSISSTQQGIMKGKIGWAAPEQCLGRPADARADLFAVGVMLWEAIAGRRRVVVESSLAALQARVSDQEPQLEDVVQGVSPVLARICRRAVSVDPEQRHASALEFKRELDSYLAEVDPLVNDRGTELAALMREHFGADFSQLRSTVEAYVQEGRRTSTRRVLITGDGAQRGEASISQPASVAAEREPVGAVYPANARVKNLLVIAGVATLAGLVALGTLFAPPAKSSSAAAAGKAVSAQAAPPLPAVPVAPTAAANSVRVAIAATPKRAQITLDGEPLSNPFVGELPKDNQLHQLEVRATGYRTERRPILMGSDLAISLELTPEAARPREAPISGRGNQQPAGPPLALQPAVAPPIQPAARSALSATAVQPGQDLKKPVRGGRAIDEKDPYQ